MTFSLAAGNKNRSPDRVRDRWQGMESRVRATDIQSILLSGNMCETKMYGELTCC
jgi:hypothetical protein